jgi:hypothetical protein
MTHYADIKLPICPVCPAVLDTLGMDEHNETVQRAEFRCGAVATISLFGGKGWRWVTPCSTLTQHMTSGDLQYDD